MASLPSTQPHDAHAPHRRTSPVLVFVILAVATIIEIGLSLLALPDNLLIPTLMAISFVKAALVAAYYMHLRYEKWYYTAIFLVPAAFAVFLLVTVMA